ncbi:ribosome recycling factor [Tuberibacillus sp. Marseille-P3662]|uniref:ribosome recycling factor n=1 Tax=Tuberibacillus sp. Marseille-P3662 TaxID=1965358 RepID=UPI000A1CA911|nr:ribosome recycling factor [Tuberibacillus sp. Marseille-P3662]
MSDEVINETKERMKKAVNTFKQDLATIRAGRANPAILDKVQVLYYGAPTPLNQLANVSAPEARLLVIQPFDKSAIGEMEKAILKADLGLTPSSDGNVIRINIPALTEERRKDLVKQVGKYTEDAKVSVRNIRRDANDTLKKDEKNGDITEDDLRRATEDVQKVTDEYVNEIDKIAQSKENEIKEV